MAGLMRRHLLYTYLQETFKAVGKGMLVAWVVGRKHNGKFKRLSGLDKTPAICSNMEGIMLSEISQAQKDKYCMALLICRI
jgi:hypothetical protein